VPFNEMILITRTSYEAARHAVLRIINLSFPENDNKRKYILISDKFVYILKAGPCLLTFFSEFYSISD
jgi:hypothetical protein